MKHLHISTPYGNHYTVNEQGCISRDDFPGFSGNWKLLGIRHVKMTSLFIPLSKLLEEGYIDSLQWRFKNGYPCFTVQDCDYGTTRLWGNTHYHGIRYMRLEGE